jgi:shikimate dehydrogenase
MGVELGLLGNSIGRSMAPMLHEFLGRQTNRDVTYVLHDQPPTFASQIPEFLKSLAARGVTGINVTFPFKELVVPLIAIDDDAVRAIGAVNTIRFGVDGAKGFNTDYSGMKAAFARRFRDQAPGVVAQLGAGGLGKAALFAMVSLGAQRIHLYDPDRTRAYDLANTIEEATETTCRVCESAEEASDGADGILNCSPIGMYVHPGCPVDPAAMKDARWVFDGVYAPLETEFLKHADQLGISKLSGSALFFWQGIHAFEIFHRATLDEADIEAAATFVNHEIARRSSAGL